MRADYKTRVPPRDRANYTSSHRLFFFQAEDGIRDRNVTGVQTCALPILAARAREIATPRAAPGRVARGDFKTGCARARGREIGRASCRERVWMWVGGVLLYVRRRPE